jgi:hypothetical protein
MWRCSTELSHYRGKLDDSRTQTEYMLTLCLYQITVNGKRKAIPRTHLAMSLQGWGPYLKYTTPVLGDGERLDVSHLCGHSHCYRPSHLLMETYSENLRRQNCYGDSTDSGTGRITRCTHGDDPKSSAYRRPCFSHDECSNNCLVHLQRFEKANRQLNSEIKLHLERIQAAVNRSDRLGKEIALLTEEI